MRITVVIGLLAVFSVGCDKSSDEPKQVKAPEAAAPAAVPDKAPDKAPADKPADDGWTRYDGPEDFDIEKGLDGAVKGAVKAMNSKMTDYKKTKIGGHPARTFSFEGSTQGYSFMGLGVAIGSSPKEIKSAMTLYQKGSATSPAKGKKFVESFEVK